MSDLMDGLDTSEQPAANDSSAADDIDSAIARAKEEAVRAVAEEEQDEDLNFLM